MNRSPLKPRPRLFVLLTCSSLLNFSSPFASAESLGGHQGGGGGNGGGSAQMQFASQLTGTDPVIQPFKKMFDKCANQALDGYRNGGPCQFQNLGVQPSGEHCAKSPGSCHNIGKAIDVGKIQCAGRTVDPKTNKEYYNKFAQCFLTDGELSGQGKFNQVIYAYPDRGIQQLIAEKMRGGATLVQKSDHDTHVHIQWDCHYGEGAGACSGGR